MAAKTVGGLVSAATGCLYRRNSSVAAVGKVRRYSADSDRRIQGAAPQHLVAPEHAFVIAGSGFGVDKCACSYGSLFVPAQGGIFQVRGQQGLSGLFPLTGLIASALRHEQQSRGSWHDVACRKLTGSPDDAG